MALFLRAQHLKEFPEWMPAEVREEVVAEGMNRVSIDKSFAFWLAAGVLSVGIGLGLAWGAPPGPGGCGRPRLSGFLRWWNGR
jgi:hypothetical protein